MRTAGRSVMPIPDPALVARLREAFESLDPDIRPGVMFGCPAFYTGRKLVAVVLGDTVALRLPASEVEELLEQEGFSPFCPLGKAPSREWISLGATRVAELREEPALLERSIEHARQS